MSSARSGALRPDIQGLRALAVGGVIADHLIHWPQAGFVGVDVFFVISGFLITGLLMREFERRGTISFVGFYIRRIKRILPAGLFVLLATTAASYALLGASRFSSLVTDVVWCALFSGNWRFAEAGTDYFQQSRPVSPVQHYWSLGVEEQFYFFWPWLMLGLLLLGIRLGWWGTTHPRRVAASAIVTISVASLAWALYETVVDPTYAYFSTLSRTWELGAGAAVAIASGVIARHLTPVRKVQSILAWGGLAGIVVSYLIVPATGFPAPWGILPVVSTASVIAAGVVNARQPSLLTNRVSGYLGDISYSLYLWHFPVITLLLTVMAGGSPMFWLVGGGATVALSAVSYRYLEEPARRHDWFRRRAGRLVGMKLGWLWLAATCIVVVTAASGLHTLVQTDQVSDHIGRAKQVYVGHTSDDPHDCFGAAAMDPTHSCPLNKGAWLARNPNSAASDTGGSYACYAQRGHPIKACVYGSKAKDAIRVAVIGDSHAAALLPALWPQLNGLDWRMTTFVGRNCKWGSLAKLCVSETKRQKRIASGDFDLVIAASRRQPSNALHVDLLARRMRAVVRSGTEVVVLADNPQVTSELMECINRVGFNARRTCSMPLKVAYGDGTDELVSAARRVKGVRVVRTTDLYCRSGRCPAVIGNVIVYADLGGHTTGTYQRTASPYVVGRIKEAAGL